MSTPFLEVSFRHGRPFAAYLHCLPPVPAARTQDLGHGLIADLSADGAMIGVEICDPSHTTATMVAQAVERLGVRLSPGDLAPLAA